MLQGSISGASRLKKAQRILIVDDETNIRRILTAYFEKAGFQVDSAESAIAGLRMASEQAYQCVISDITMPGMNGYEFLKELKLQDENLPVVLVTAFGTIPQAVQAIRDGAFEYITKPFDLESLKKIVSTACSGESKKRRGKGNSSLKGEKVQFIAESSVMKDIETLLTRIADSKATVMIGGESGVGKEVIAKILHERSSRAKGPFVAVSCAALPETLLESELFGYEEGAFTGASSEKMGRFEAASGGTLFLDEVGEIPAGIQVKLLRALQERQIERLGGNAPIHVEVRVITATHRNLQEAVSAGTFRLDLLYRLQVIEVQIPSLRDRVEDIAPLARHFLEKYCAENDREPIELSSDVLESLCQYSWPGNVRELENTIERAVVLASPGTHLLTLDLLPDRLVRAA